MERIVERVDSHIPVPPRALRVCAYARVSSGKDAMLHSLSAQVSYYSNLIQNHSGWLYCGVYSDEAMTGTKSQRDDFQRMIEDCHKGKIDLVITKSISRFARNTVTLLQTVRELKSLGIDVYFEEQHIHTISADGELMMTILASYAQEESLSASENQKWRVRKAFENGELINLRFLFGYSITADGVQINEEKAAVVREIFSRFNSGESMSSISRDLNARGYRGALGGRWCAERMRNTLSNEKYLGNALLQKRCFIYVSYDLSGVGVAKGAKFYLNDTPCKLDWENKFFWTETMTAEGNPVQEDPVITAKAGANGTITPSGSVTVKAGADQAFAIQPNSGYTVSKVLVDGTDVGAVTSYTFKNVTANHTIEAVFAKVEAKPTNPFVDVAEGTYYYDPVLWAVANGITSGVDATHFEPEGTCTRAHAVTFLWRASGQPEPKTTNMPFRDVKPGSYYEKAVLWAVENKITNGTGTTTFSPDENCTRAQIVTFLWRSEGEPYASDSNNPFTDIASDYYMDAVFWAVKEGITNGTTPTTFSPNERCTRAQIVTFIYRAMAS